MEMLDIHAAALASGNVAYHEFLLCYKGGQRIVYGLVEGREDPCFYRGMIEQMLPDGWEVKLICAGNRRKVLRVLQDMDWTRFPKKRICFFIDRDLSEFLSPATISPDNLYVTDNYSVDSEIVSSKTFQRVLEEILGITDLSPDESATITKLFERNLATFREALCPVMAQILLWRRAKAKAYLDSIEPKDFFTFVDCQLYVKPEFAPPYDRVVHAARAANIAPSAFDDIAKAEAEFRDKQGPEKFTRGKYLLWFFIQFAKEIHRATPKFCAKSSTPPKARVELGVANVTAVVAPRVRCPASLKTFIERNYFKYIAEAAFAE